MEVLLGSKFNFKNRKVCKLKKVLLVKVIIDTWFDHEIQAESGRSYIIRKTYRLREKLIHN